MTVVWGYSPEETLELTKEVGKEVQAVKQVFSALLFKAGIKGICTRIPQFEDNTSVIIKLYIDSIKVFKEEFSPQGTIDYYFELPDVIYPKSKIEVVLEVKRGFVTLPVSSIGTGMGFQKTDDKFQPTNHLPIGLILP